MKYSSILAVLLCTSVNAAEVPQLTLSEVRPFAYATMFYAESDVRRQQPAVYEPVELPDGHVFLHLVCWVKVAWPGEKDGFFKLPYGDYTVSDGQKSYEAIGALGGPWHALYRKHSTFYSQATEQRKNVARTRQDMIFIVPKNSKKLALTLHNAEQAFTMPKVQEPTYHQIIRIESVRAKIVDQVPISKHAGGGFYKNPDPKGRVALVKFNWSFVPTPEIQKTESHQMFLHEWINIRYKNGRSPNVGALSSQGELYKAYVDKGNSTNTSGAMPKPKPGWKPYVHKDTVFAFPIPRGETRLQLTLAGRPVSQVIRAQQSEKLGSGRD